MMLHTNTAVFETQIKNSDPVVNITQTSTGASVVLKNSADLLNILNMGGNKMIRTFDGDFIEITFNPKNKHLRMTKNVINTYLTNPSLLEALKQELSDAIAAVYPEDLPW